MRHRSVDRDDFGHGNRSMVALQYVWTVCCDRVPDLTLFHSADMRRDGHRAVTQLAHAVGIEDAALALMAEATACSAVRANFVPGAGTGFQKCEAGFSWSARSNKRDGQLTGDDPACYDARLANCVEIPR